MSHMRSPRFAVVSILLLSLSFLLSPSGRSAGPPTAPGDRNRVPVRSAAASTYYPALVAQYHGDAASTLAVEVPVSDHGGIREDIPEKYMAHYQQWKKEFLATETGRQQWASYQDNANLTLTVTVSRENPTGGTTSNYRWNEAGELVAATITLGCRLDAGFPNPVYFPVMNSLLPTKTTRRIDGNTLAATKFAHELGHVNRTAKGDPVLYQLQSQLMPEYNQIFLSNGRNPNDPRLIELARRMGGTPVEIWEDREYWGETNAMLYLRDRFAEDGFRCLLFSRIKRSLDLYARNYQARFLKIVQSTPSSGHCGW